MKKILNFLATTMCMAVVLFGTMSLKAVAANVTTGTLGENGKITWTYDADTKTMTLVGDGTLETVYWWEEPFEEICPDVQKIIVKNCKVDTCDGMFYGLEEVQSIEFDNFDVSQSTSLNCMFDGCRKLSSVDVSDFNTSKVMNMSYMFFGCESLSSVDVSGFDTSNVTSMCGMFYDCKSLNSVDVSNFDTSQVTDMFGMFLDCENLSSVDVSGFDTSKVMNMSYMFFGCSNLKSVDVSGFDTSLVTNMCAMFNRCSGLSSLNVSGFDTSKVTDMSTMFYYCENLSSLDVSKFDTSNVTDMSSMFNGCKSLTGLDLSKFDTSCVTDVSWMFTYCANLKSMNLSNFDLSNVTSAEDTLYGCKALEVVYAPKKLPANLSIELGGTFADEQGNLTNSITAAFCNKTLCRPGVGQVRAFVERMYTVALGRAAEAEGADFYVQRLLSGDSNGACIAESFLCSPEFLNKGHSDAEYVKVLYRTFFDREPAAEEVNYWVNKLASGESKAFVLSGFVNSVEFDNLCADYGISRGFMREDGKPLNPGIGRFAERLYTVVLERAGEKEGIEYWSLSIANGVCTPKDAAKSFFLSSEYINKNTSDAQYITTLYRTFMDREPEAGGVEYWLNVLNNGATREQILEGFADSAEFKGIMANFGL